MELHGLFLNSIIYGPSVSDPYSSNPDPAKNLNPDLDPDRPWIQILAISLHYLKINLNYFIIISFYHQKKSIKRKNVVVPKKESYVMII